MTKTEKLILAALARKLDTYGTLVQSCTNVQELVGTSHHAYLSQGKGAFDEAVRLLKLLIEDSAAVQEALGIVTPTPTPIPAPVPAKAEAKATSKSTSKKATRSYRK